MIAVVYLSLYEQRVKNKTILLTNRGCYKRCSHKPASRRVKLDGPFLTLSLTFIFSSSIVTFCPSGLFFILSLPLPIISDQHLPFTSEEFYAHLLLQLSSLKLTLPGHSKCTHMLNAIIFKITPLLKFLSFLSPSAFSILTNIISCNNFSIHKYNGGKKNQVCLLKCTLQMLISDWRYKMLLWHGLMVVVVGWKSALKNAIAVEKGWPYQKI